MWSIIYTELYWKGFDLLIHLPYYLANYVIYHIHRIILKRIRSFDTFAILLGKLCDLSYTQEDERNELKKKLFWHYDKNVIFIFMHFFHPTWNYRNFHQNDDEYHYSDTWRRMGRENHRDISSKTIIAQIVNFKEKCNIKFYFCIAGIYFVYMRGMGSYKCNNRKWILIIHMIQVDSFLSSFTLKIFQYSWVKFNSVDFTWQHLSSIRTLMKLASPDQ